MDGDQSITTRLLTLLNVSATRAARSETEDSFVHHEKLNKRQNGTSENVMVVDIPEPQENAMENDVDIDLDPKTNAAHPDWYELHFGNKPSALSADTIAAVEGNQWISRHEDVGRLGRASVSIPNSQGQAATWKQTPDIQAKLKEPMESRQKNYLSDQAQLQNDVVATLSTRQDLYLTAAPLASRKYLREAITLHALNHVTKKRRRVLKNNERVAHTLKSDATAPPPEDVQDQGFTRPSVLFLLPTRSSALEWFKSFSSHTPSPAYQIENHARFLSEYGLPPGAVDKLAAAEPGTYPLDHVETFKGNVDDNFRIGIKLTRKSVKLFADFYGCDVILASPLGLRRSIEKEKHADYLSSVEVFVVGEADVLTMQNWEHVKFVVSHLNKMPKESRDADFSRIKSWYLDGHAQYVRQSILISAYETPEIRALFNTSFKNVAGKIRTQKRWAPVQVPEGVDQTFLSFDCASPVDEADKRFNYFTTQLLPTILKSAVYSANTAIVVPSSFDFIRVQNYLKKQAALSFAVLSEYSTNPEISRARQSFFEGKKSFLLLSERFHFYKRYKIRGIRHLIFYSPPSHSQFYTELLSFPFLDDGVEASDVKCWTIYSRFDWFALERIVGTEGGMTMRKS